MTLGDTMRQQRESLGITQQKLADNLFVSRQTVCRWESGTRYPDLSMLRKIAAVLNLSLDDLIPTEESYLQKLPQSVDQNGVFAGFDCGGSNTRCMLVSKDGRVLGVGKGGPSNYLTCGKLVARQSVEDSLLAAFREANLPVCELEGVFVASAAIEVFDGAAHEAFFEEITGCKNVSCNSDIFPVWYAATRFEDAIAMIAGTGSVAYLLQQDRFLKAGGWGALFGDEGSGYHVGVSALRTVAHMEDGRLPKDPLFCQAVLAHFGVLDDPRQLCHHLNLLTPAKHVAKVTETVLKLGEQGNETALKLIDQAAESLALAIRTLTDKTEGTFTLVLWGGLLQHDTPIRRRLAEKVEKIPCIRNIEVPAHEAVRSAAAIALRNNGYEEAAERLLKTK